MGSGIDGRAGGHEFSTYTPIPFLLSQLKYSRGYFFENKTYSVMDLSSEQSLKYEVREKGLQGTIWKGENIIQVLEQYTKKTGRFPLSRMGLWYLVGDARR